MSASRTLLRKLTTVPVGTKRPGGKRLARGIADRRILWRETILAVEFSFHATKGRRRIRVSGAA
jgi:hypothetical protein